jgi:FlaG/FlaF family flagellin (archaellin)
MPLDSAPQSVDRGVSPVVGVAILAFLTILLSVTIVTAVPSLSADPQPTARLTLDADASTDRIALTHRQGDALDVTELNLTVRVGGTRLSHQPPVPFFGAEGFESGPTGPFNTASPNDWRAGETGGVRIASTNGPQLSPGATVVVTVATERGVVYEGSVQAR